MVFPSYRSLAIVASIALARSLGSLFLKGMRTNEALAGRDNGVFPSGAQSLSLKEPTSQR